MDELSDCALDVYAWLSPLGFYLGKNIILLKKKNRIL